MRGAGRGGLALHAEVDHVCVRRALGVGAVFPRVTVATGAIVGDGSVVRKDLDAWVIYSRNPLRKVGSRADRAATLADDINQCEGQAA